MNILKWILEKTILNWERPLYSKKLFLICSRYIDLWYGDNNFNRNTNGEFRILKKIIPESKVVLDVGANIGEYSAEMLKINPNLKIHAFEPFLDSFNKLKQVPVIANNIALGEKDEIRVLHQMGRSTHNSFYTESSDGKKVQVKVSTLDAYCEKNNIKHIDFLKIDVEGHEFAVLQGATNVLKQQAVDYIQFEFSGATALSRVFLKDFIDLLNTYNYDLYRVRGTDIQFVDYYPDRERFTLTNYLAIRKNIFIP